MGAVTYRALSPLSQSGSCVQTDNLSSNRPLLFDSALTCRHAIRMSPNIFPCSFFIHSHPALSSRGQVQTPTQGKGPGMTEYQRSWLDSFFGGFLSPFLLIYACRPVCVSVCDDEPWCQMALFVCTRSRAHNTAVAEKPAVGRYEYFNNRRTNTRAETQFFPAELLRKQSLHLKKALFICDTPPWEWPLTWTLGGFQTLYALILEAKLDVLFCCFGRRTIMYERPASRNMLHFDTDWQAVMPIN